VSTWIALLVIGFILKNKAMLFSLRAKEALAHAGATAPSSMVPPPSRDTPADFPPPFGIALGSLLFVLVLHMLYCTGMKQLELEDVQLPWVSTPQAGQRPDCLIVNVCHPARNDTQCASYREYRICHETPHWRISIAGRNYTSPGVVGQRMREEADRLPDPGDPRFSFRRVHIRADASAPYGMVSEVIEACRQAGIYKVEFGAAPMPVTRRTGENAGANEGKIIWKSW
jgi:hypothetical protein